MPRRIALSISCTTWSANSRISIGRCALASCCGVGPPVSCAAALAATTEPVTIPSSARRRASLLLVKMRFKPSSAQSASLPDIRVPLPHRRLDALHRCPPITSSAASTRRPFWWQATPAWRSLGPVNPIVGRFRLQQVAGGSGQPVEPPRHGEHVARLKLVEQPAKLC